MKLATTIISTFLGCSLLHAQTDAYLKLNDIAGKHPRIESVTFPGDANLLDMYNSIYGHGAVIENPWVAYRVYMDNRQSLDLYVKQTPKLELESTGFYTTPEQLNQGYGCDVLWAGASIGAGSFRGWHEDSPATIDTVASRTQTILNDSTVRIIDRDWLYNGHKIQMSQTYSVCSDSRDLLVEIKLDGNLPGDIFCTGIQKLESDNIGFLDTIGIAGSWGTNIPDKNHPQWSETVGLGIIVNPENVAGVKEDDLNYLIFLKPDTDGIIRYKVISCGTRESSGFKTADRWFSHIKATN
ncbi:MAG: DUF4861 domain-containing protein [Muribaculum sp.]|nr:DUF4861 domain-containing protein [Muribaculum sp.]